MYRILFFLTTALAAFGAKPLVVITRNAPTTYYINAVNRPTGFEYDLASAFGAYLKRPVRFVVEDSVSDVLKALKKGKGDMAAAGLTRTAVRDQTLIPGPGYLNVRQQLVCRSGLKPKKITDLLDKKIELIADSSYVETFHKLKRRYPKLRWIEHKGYTTEHIFERLHQKKIDCTLADSNIVDINRRYYPHLEVPLRLSDPETLVWYFPNTPQGKALARQAKKWFESFKKSHAFRQIKERYFGHIVKYDYVDTARYHKRIKTRLPKYLAAFKKAGKKHGIDWRILAAQAYQESHWNPKAKSPTGVRGMMMLTLATAKELGVKNRLNYRQSIDGGAKYLKNLLKRIPKEVTNPYERYYYALAAYNVGMGHLYDAVRLGKQLGINPYRWHNMKTLLPKLAERKYYKQLRYGYARGSEPVRYVTRIVNYFEILRKYYPNPSI